MRARVRSPRREGRIKDLGPNYKAPRKNLQSHINVNLTRELLIRACLSNINNTCISNIFAFVGHERTSQVTQR